MAANKNCCYLGRGKISLKKCLTDEEIAANGDSEFVEVGNASDFTVTTNVNNLTVKNYQLKCGTECSYDELESITMSLDLTCHDRYNLEKAFLGNSYDIDATPEVPAGPNSVNQVVSGAYVPIAIPADYDSALPFTVTVEGADETADFTIVGGLLTYTGATPPADTETVIFAYTTLAIAAKSASVAINLFQCLSAEYEFLFEGCNAASSNDNNEFKVSFWRVKLSPAADFSFIGDDFNTFTLTGTLLADPTRTLDAGAAGTFPSEYGRFDIID